MEINEFLKREALPRKYRDTAEQWLLPLAAQLQKRLSKQPGKPLVVGISGAQGTGKSTASRFLCEVLRGRGFRVAAVSIDDFYLSHAQRRILAQKTHPLLASRGVPGTHNLKQLKGFLQSVLENGNDTVTIPVFSKSTDDPLPEHKWVTLDLPLDLVVIEGWFVGATPQKASALEEAVNELERNEDADGSWRKYVNQSLRQYQSLFAALDCLILLKAPSFDCVYQWRRLQEAKLIASADAGKGIMNRQQLDRFIQHFERLTRHCLETLPNTADVIFELDVGQQIQSGYYRRFAVAT